MKISNPRLYGVSNLTGSILTTVSYVNKQISNLSSGVFTTINNVSGEISTSINNLSENVSASVVSLSTTVSENYVPLTNGEIDSQYLPDLAITSVKTCASQTDFFSVISSAQVEWVSEVGSFMDITSGAAAVALYIEAEQKETSGKFEEGDVFILSPSQEQITNGRLNDNILGSWIIQHTINGNVVPVKMYVPQAKVQSISLNGIIYQPSDLRSN